MYTHMATFILLMTARHHMAVTELCDHMLKMKRSCDYPLSICLTCGITDGNINHPVVNNHLVGIRTCIRVLILSHGMNMYDSSKNLKRKSKDFHNQFMTIVYTSLNKVHLTDGNMHRRDDPAVNNHRYNLVGIGVLILRKGMIHQRILKLIKGSKDCINCSKRV